jgi:hypothetical protein
MLGHGTQSEEREGIVKCQRCINENRTLEKLHGPMPDIGMDASYLLLLLSDEKETRIHASETY